MIAYTRPRDGVYVRARPRAAPKRARGALAWKYRTSSSQEEGGEREFAVMTKRFLGDANGRLRAIEAVRVELGPEAQAWSGLPVATDPRSNVRADTDSFVSSVPGVFACGDARRGQSLVVWAIWEGREAARAVDRYLVGESQLQSRNAYV